MWQATALSSILWPFLAPATDFVEDNFSTDQGGGDGFYMIQARYIYYALYF